MGGCTGTFAGTWDSTDGKLTITLDGTEASGVYKTSDTISGTVRGNVLEGQWRKPSGRSGRFRFDLNAEATSFTGVWFESGKNKGKWNGDCISSGGGPGGGALGGVAGLCADPRVLAFMDEWLSQAIPPQEPGESLYFDKWGRILGRGRKPDVVLTTKQNPDAHSRCEWLWYLSPTLKSENMGTLQSYLLEKLK